MERRHYRQSQKKHTSIKTKFLNITKQFNDNNTTLEWEPISPRIISTRFNSKGRKTTITQCYAPTNVAEDDAKEEFYNALQSMLDRAQRRDLKFLMGDLNAKVGENNTDKKLIMDKHGVGTRNQNGELFTSFCAFNDLVIGGTIFPHKTTWVSSDTKTENPIDHITIARKWRRSLLDVRMRRGADAAADHHLVLATLKVKRKSFRDMTDRPHYKVNVQSLKTKVKAEVCGCKLKNKFDTLSGLLEETIDEHKCTCSKALRNEKRNTKNGSYQIPAP